MYFRHDLVSIPILQVNTKPFIKHLFPENLALAKHCVDAESISTVDSRKLVSLI